jgi:hypothetical protein
MGAYSKVHYLGMQLQELSLKQLEVGCLEASQDSLFLQILKEGKDKALVYSELVRNN